MNEVIKAKADEGLVKAVLYCRFSSENQREESIDGQRRECTDFANRNGIRILKEYDDRAKSATTDDRPDFQRMIAESKNGGFNAVLVWKFDRFARNRLDSLKYKAILRKNGVRLISATEKIMDGPDGILMESLLDGLNEYYSADLSQKVKRGMTENVLKGKAIGGARQFGYQIVSGKYVIDENESKIVKEAFRLYANDGMNLNAIAKKLNGLGMRRTDGRMLNHNLIEKVISSDRYIGVLRCAGAENRNAIPPIIDEATFNKAQARRKTRKHCGGAFREGIEFALRGRIYCGECGEMLNGESGTSKSGALHSYYKCKGARKRKCDLKPIRKEDVELTAILAVKEVLRDDENSERLAKVIYGLQGKETPEMTSLKERANQTDVEIGNIMTAIKAGIFTKTTKGELEKLEGEKDEVEASINKEAIHHRAYSKAEIKVALQILADYNAETDAQKRAFVATFINRVVVYKTGKIRIYANIFGASTEIQTLDKAINGVRTGTLLPRHSEMSRHASLIRAFSFISTTK